MGSNEHESLTTVRDADDVLLAKLGYKSVFKREFSLWETTAFAFATMGGLTSVVATMSFPLLAGGHIGMTLGWIIPCLFVMTVAVSLAELTSSMPTSGGMYYFSAKLAPKRWAPLACWITGWANITGQVVLMCSGDILVAQMIATVLRVASDGGIQLGTDATYGIMLALLITHGVICSAATASIARLVFLCGLLNVAVGMAAAVALLVCSGDQRVSSQTAFTMFENHTGWSSNGWAFLLSFTAPMWTLTGYDSAAHISEEMTGASRTAPLAMVLAVGGTSVLCWILYIASSYATVSVPQLTQTPLPMPMGQLLLDVLGKRGMMAIWSILIVVQYVCAAAQGVDASRVVFAFARDNALPGSRWWRQIHPYTRTPVKAVWLIIGLSAIVGLLEFSSTALTSLAGASVIGMYISYITPVFLRVTFGRKKLQPGPFSLGAWYIPINIIAIAWVGFISILLLIPPEVPPTAATMNYSIVILMAVFLFASVSWIVSARKWFKGPVRTIDDDEASEGLGYDEKDGTQVNEVTVSGNSR